MRVTANQLAMKRGPLVAISLLLLGGVLPSPALAAPERDPGPYWHAETEGSPVTTEIGQWQQSADGRTVRLEFQGGHVIGTNTKIIAGWLTPFTTRREVPRFELSYEMTNYNDLGQDIRQVHMFRFRDRGDEWWPWIRWPKDPLSPGTHYVGGVMGFEGHKKRQMQFEWRIKIFIEAPTYLGGFVEASID